MEISFDQVSRVLSADFETGKMHWLQRPEDLVPNPKRVNSVNRKFCGKPAFETVSAQGYKMGTLFGRKYMAHRILWLLWSGDWPEMIDHINGNKSDNRIVNLRNVTRAENMKNRPMPSSNTSGVVGVRWHKASNHWIAHIHADGVSRHLGSFKSFEEAREARRSAEALYGFHPNHGRVA